jgi:glycosyltransferase involved in cell wall biosynthesis
VKLAYVTVRYGPSVVGGAEQACRQLAEHLAADGADVEVFTTCAADASTWADVLPPGTTHEGGVTVHRYRSEAGRDPRFDELSAPVLANPRGAGAEQEAWLYRQGPVCAGAVNGAESSEADLVVCTPYLYWPTVETIRRLGRRTVLQPAAHDEPPIHLPLFASVFGGSRGLAYYTDAERRTAERLFPALSASPQLVAGIGVESEMGAGADPAVFRASAAIDDRPYILCLGRVDNGKGARLLGRLFAAYKRRRPGPLALVFAGPVVHQPDPHPDVVVTGPHSDAAFETALDRILGDPRLAAAMGAAGHRYVEEHFAWPVVTGRYRRWLERLAASPERR